MNDTLIELGNQTIQSTINPDFLVLGFGGIALIIFVGLLIWTLTK